MYEVKVEGIDELKAKLRKLSDYLKPEALEKILEAEAQSFAAKLLPRTPQGPTGNLRNGVRAWVPKRNTRQKDAMAIAGVHCSVAPHAWIVEYGTVARYTKGGAYRGVMPPQQYFTPLKEQEEPGMLTRIIDKVLDHILKEWNGR